MSLRAFHIFFITVASALAFGFGVWALRYHQSQSNIGYLGMGIASLLMGVGLVCYGIWFWRKLNMKSTQ